VVVVDHLQLEVPRTQPEQREQHQAEADERAQAELRGLGRRIADLLAARAHHSSAAVSAAGAPGAGPRAPGTAAPTAACRPAAPASRSTAAAAGPAAGAGPR